jgi:hypothetical protein
VATPCSPFSASSGTFAVLSVPFPKAKMTSNGDVRGARFPGGATGRLSRKGPIQKNGCNRIDARVVPPVTAAGRMPRKSSIESQSHDFGPRRHDGGRTLAEGRTRRLEKDRPRSPPLRRRCSLTIRLSKALEGFAALARGEHQCPPPFVRRCSRRIQQKSLPVSPIGIRDHAMRFDVPGRCGTRRPGQRWSTGTE